MHHGVSAWECELLDFYRLILQFLLFIRENLHPFLIECLTSEVIWGSIEDSFIFCKLRFGQALITALDDSYCGLKSPGKDGEILPGEYFEVFSFENLVAEEIIQREIYRSHFLKSFLWVGCKIAVTVKIHREAFLAI